MQCNIHGFRRRTGNRILFPPGDEIKGHYSVDACHYLVQFHQANLAQMRIKMKSNYVV